MHREYVVFVLVALGLVLSGCGTPGVSDNPDEPEGSPEKGGTTEEGSTSLGRASSLIGFGEGSLWVSDHGDYACDDTPGMASDATGPSWRLVSCANPEDTFLRRIDPGSLEEMATVRFMRTDVSGVAFGAGAVWLSLSGRGPSGGGVARLDPTTNKVTDNVRVKSPIGVDFGDGALWVASRNGTVSRVDPGSGEVEAKIRVSAGGANDVAVDEKSGAVWFAVTGSPEDGAELSPEDYDRGTRPKPNEDFKLVRVDLATNRVVAEVPIEENAIEGGASSVAVGGGAVWVTSVNGKLLRVDPATNRVVDKLSIGDYSFDVEASEESVWASSEVNVNDHATYTHRLTRVDPTSNHIVDSVDVKNASGLALAESSAWATSGNIETGEGSLISLTP